MEEQSRIKEAFQGKRIKILQKIQGRDFYWKGKCIEITKYSCLLQEDKKGFLSLPLSECSLEVIQ